MSLDQKERQLWLQRIIPREAHRPIAKTVIKACLRDHATKPELLWDPNDRLDWGKRNKRSACRKDICIRLFRDHGYAKLMIAKILGIDHTTVIHYTRGVKGKANGTYTPESEAEQGQQGRGPADQPVAAIAGEGDTPAVS